jgi:hypothetical protein
MCICVYDLICAVFMHDIKTAVTLGRVTTCMVHLPQILLGAQSR